MTSLLRSPTSLLLLSSLCVACADAPLEDASLDDAPLDEHRISDVAGTAIVCDPTHQVVRLSMPPEADGAPSCEDFPGIGWEAEPLFASATAPVSVLDQYCRYTFVPAAGATKTDVDLLAANFPTDAELGADCQAVTPQGEVIADTIGEDLDLFFGYLAGRVDGTGLQDAYPLAARSSVQTTVVDTFPRPEPGNPISSHGPVVMSIIEAIACPQGTEGCDIEVGAALGLPRTENGINTNRGGVVGLQSDLAQGIFTALERHRASSSEHLVINLSVGWESVLFGGSSLTDMPPATRAVLDAIRMARCEGSLIIASAGNSTGLTCNEVPLAPGRWEEIPAPTADECASMGATAFVPDSVDYRPLVHAVGGLFGPNSEMGSSREFGMPRLAAAASHAVAHPRKGLPEVAIRTGTSMSAAVASAAASLVWSYRPSLTPAKVMHVLYETGALSPGTSDFGGGTPVDVRRIDTCSAVEFVCALPGSTCGAVGTALDCNSGTTASLSGMVAAIEDLPASTLKIREADFATTPQTCFGACGREIEFHSYFGETRSCEATERDPWARLTSPQPPKSGCNDCVLTGTNTESTALLTVDSEFAGDALLSVDIVVLDGAEMKHVYSLKDIDTGLVPELEDTRVASYELPVDLDGIEVRGATVLMTFASGAETEDPMLLK